MQHGPRGFPIAILITVALLNGVRGTFTHCKLPAIPPGTPSLEQAFSTFRKVPIPRDINPPSE